jgi:hypothetical protein
MDNREDITDKMLDKILEVLDSEEDKLEELEDWNPVPLNSGKKVSELTVGELRDILREEIGRLLPIYTVPKYEGFEIPHTPGELNNNSKFNITDHTVFKSDKFHGWGHGYGEI